MASNGKHFDSVMIRVSADFADVIRRIAERENAQREYGASVVQVTRELAEMLRGDLEG